MKITSPAAEWVDYRRRARLYFALDRQLEGRTRFFGAASAVCDVLARFSLSVARVALTVEGRQILSTLSAQLEQLNLRIAESVRDGRIQVAGLDGHIVNMEQSHVQWQLERMGAARASRPLEDFNRLLNARGFRIALAHSRSGRLFAAALLRARRGIGRSIDFARQSDREAIGNGIIDAVRASDHPVVRRVRPEPPVTFRMASLSERAAAS